VKQTRPAASWSCELMTPGLWHAKSLSGGALFLFLMYRQIARTVALSTFGRRWLNEYQISRTRRQISMIECRIEQLKNAIRRNPLIAKPSRAASPDIIGTANIIWYSPITSVSVCDRKLVQLALKSNSRSNPNKKWRHRLYLTFK